MGYTWADAMLAIDRGAEGRREQKELDDILAERDKEGKAKGIGGWIGQAIGFIVGSIFGKPLEGAKAGKHIVKAGVDQWGPGSDWEDMTVSEGKFNIYGSQKANEALTKAADDETVADWLNVGTDIATSFIDLGGFEGAKAVKEYNLDLPMVETGEMIEDLASGEMVPEMVQDDPISFWKGYGHSELNPEGVAMPTLSEAWGANTGEGLFKQLGGTLMDIGAPAYGTMKSNQLDKVLTNVIGNSPQAQCIASGGSWDWSTSTCSEGS
jgi:hypothetical protein